MSFSNKLEQAVPLDPEPQRLETRCWILIYWIRDFDPENQLFILQDKILSKPFKIY
jgi:hypothetical protein